jgi:negative regulator of flagellin synthesis FlgM
MIINIGEVEIMDINNLLRGVGTSPSKVLNQPESSVIRKSADDKGTAVSSEAFKTEKVTITDTTSRLRQLSQSATQQPEVNNDKVANIRAALADGSYKVQPGVIAARLMAFEAALRR